MLVTGKKYEIKPKKNHKEHPFAVLALQQRVGSLKPVLLLGSAMFDSASQSELWALLSFSIRMFIGHLQASNLPGIGHQLPSPARVSVEGGEEEGC